LKAKPSGDQGDGGSNNQPPVPEGWSSRVSLTDWITAISTLVIMLWAGLQWHEMHIGGIDTSTLADATVKMKDSAEKSATASAGFSTSAGEIDTKIGLAEKDFKQMAANSEGAIKATQEATRQDQRAWIGIGQITAKPESFHEGDQATITISLKNTGKTPAKSMLLTAVKDPRTKGASPIFSYEGEKVARFGLLPPNGDNFVRLSVANDLLTKEPRAMSKPELDSLVSGQVVIYIHGQLSYKDIFDREHWVTFCYFLMSPSDIASFGACSEHNDAGDGKIPKYQAPKTPSQWPPS
jgi:hypothetical protein